MFRKYVMKL